jgi:hypothetical protein
MGQNGGNRLSGAQAMMTRLVKPIAPLLLTTRNPTYTIEGT